MRSTVNFVFRLAVPDCVNLTEPFDPVAVSLATGAGVTAVDVLAEKLVTPGFALAVFLAVTPAMMNLPFCEVGITKLLAVAPEITEQPAGKVVAARLTLVLQEYHLVSKVGAGSPSHEPGVAVSSEPTLSSSGTSKVVGVVASGSVAAAVAAFAGRLASGNCPKTRVSRASRAVTYRFVTRIVPPEHLKQGFKSNPPG